MECTALDFRCQCTQQKLQSICAVLTFDPQLKNILTFSVKDRYQLNYFICIKVFNAETITSLKLLFFLYLRLSASWKENDLPLCIYFWYQTDSEVPNTSIYSAVSLASPYYNYFYSPASTTMICWRCHSNNVNTGSRLPGSSDVKTRKRRNVVGIDMIRNNSIGPWCEHLIHIPHSVSLLDTDSVATASTCSCISRCGCLEM